jgi:hypothetical protein
MLAPSEWRGLLEPFALRGSHFSILMYVVLCDKEPGIESVAFIVWAYV